MQLPNPIRAEDLVLTGEIVTGDIFIEHGNSSCPSEIWIDVNLIHRNGQNSHFKWPIPTYMGLHEARELAYVKLSEKGLTFVEQGYKVLLSNHENLATKLKPDIEALHLRYEPGRWTEPKIPGSGLFFFRFYSELFRSMWPIFADRENLPKPGFSIWKVTAAWPRSTNLVPRLSNCNEGDDIVAFWHRRDMRRCEAWPSIGIARAIRLEEDLTGDYWESLVNRTFKTDIEWGKENVSPEI